MANGKFTAEQSAQLSRTSLKSLIEKYNASKGQDKSILQMIIEQLAKTPLYFAVKKGSGLSGGQLSFITLSTGGQTFIPIFTGPDELGKLKDNADVVCLQPGDYFTVLSENNAHAVINPFSSYFLLWPELVREHLIPFWQRSNAFSELKS